MVDSKDELEQGDLLDSFPVVEIPTEVVQSSSSTKEAPQQIKVVNVDVIVLTQSCDLPKLKPQDSVILCYRTSYREAEKLEASIAGQPGWERLVRGYVLDLHVIDKCDITGFEFPHQVIDLQRIFTSPKEVVTAQAQRQGKRVRLCPPYREHLTQAFARRFMRVGLPADLPRKSPYVP